MKKSPSIIKSMLIFYVCISLIFIPVLSSRTSLLAQEVDCEKVLKDAEEKYTEGRFDETIALITVCLDDPNINPEQKQQAYRLMGLTYIAKDYLTEAKTAIEKLLKLVPNYKPDPIYDPPPFINLVEEVQAETIATKAVADEETTDSKIWWYVGGGVAAVALIVVLASSGGDDEGQPAEQDLPGPPDIP